MSMGQALYRKYRSKTLEEIVGQDHITKTLARAIETGRVSHAYLFTGPRGVGKTSIARILAHQLNNVIYTGESSHLDIIEIDAASNGGVDEVRDLREKVYLAPTNGKYKIYIIDEVHMMTTAAFNALLKTLEEPPAHVIFILATTEAHKLPATIVSRTQRFSFKPIPPTKVIEHLRSIATTEKIDIDNEALQLIAEHGGGSFRDSIGMLDQVSSLHQHIDRAAIEKLLGLPPTAAIEEIISSINNSNIPKLIDALTSLRTNGHQAAAIAKQIGQILRTQLLDENQEFSKTKILKILTGLIEVPASHNPDQLLELILLETAFEPEPKSTIPTKLQPSKPSEGSETKVKKEPRAQSTITSPAKIESPTITEEVSRKNVQSSTVLTDDAWQATLDALKKQYNTLYGITKVARPEFSPGKVKLLFGFAFHQKRANDAKNKNILATVIQQVTGQALSLECVYEKTLPPTETLHEETEKKDTPSATDAPSLNTISNIFGGAELLES